MSRWRKRLAAMAADPNPCSYTYDEASGILERLGFALASKGTGSHRKWRLAREGQSPVIVGLVDRGSGPMKTVYIVEMMAALRANNLLP